MEQFELMLEEIEASRAEAELRAGKTPLPDLDDAPDRSANHCPMVSPPKS
ncbi:hypothetical protein [Agrobacterium salinitolerans]|nr:hypothetical protein [Agrobacterium salinitolerans]